MLRLLRAELRKLRTTKLAWGFLATTVLLSLLVLLVVALSSDPEVADQFAPRTAPLQRSLLEFASNALLLGALFGAVASAREYGHGTVVPMFLVTPRRTRALVAKYVAVALGGAIIGAVGGLLAAGAGVVALPAAGFDLLLSNGELARLIGAAVLAGAVGALFGAGLGAVLRNTGGTVTATVVLLLIAPPLVGALLEGASPWTPGPLTQVVSGIGSEPGLLAALAALVTWGVVPAVAGLVVVEVRDVV